MCDPLIMKITISYGKHKVLTKSTLKIMRERERERVATRIQRRDDNHAPRIVHILQIVSNQKKGKNSHSLIFDRKKSQIKKTIKNIISKPFIRN